MSFKWLQQLFYKPPEIITHYELWNIWEQKYLKDWFYENIRLSSFYTIFHSFQFPVSYESNGAVFFSKRVHRVNVDFAGIMVVYMPIYLYAMVVSRIFTQVHIDLIFSKKYLLVESIIQLKFTYLPNIIIFVAIINIFN